MGFYQLEKNGENGKMLPRRTWFCSAEYAVWKLLISTWLLTATRYFPRTMLHKTRTVAPHFSIMPFYGIDKSAKFY